VHRSPGVELIDWAVESADAVGVWTTEPAYEPGFPSAPAPLSTFMQFLEGKGKVKVSMECHSLTRSDSGYTVSNSERVGFRMKDL
jgi:hypothetical protein